MIVVIKSQLYIYIAVVNAGENIFGVYSLYDTQDPIMFYSQTCHPVLHYQIAEKIEISVRLTMGFQGLGSMVLFAPFIGIYLHTFFFI